MRVLWLTTWWLNNKEQNIRIWHLIHENAQYLHKFFYKRTLPLLIPTTTYGWRRGSMTSFISSYFNSEYVDVWILEWSVNIISTLGNTNPYMYRSRDIFSFGVDTSTAPYEWGAVEMFGDDENKQMLRTKWTKQPC